MEEAEEADDDEGEYELDDERWAELRALMKDDKVQPE